MYRGEHKWCQSFNSTNNKSVELKKLHKNYTKTSKYLKKCTKKTVTNLELIKNS